MSLLSKVDLSFLQKKVRDNPYVTAVGCGVTAITLLYVLSRQSTKNIDLEGTELPDFVYPDVDREFTERFSKNNKSRKRGTSDSNKKRRNNNKLTPMGKTHNNDHDNKSNENSNNENDDNNDGFDEKEQRIMEYSPFDPNNPNYSHDLNNDQSDEHYESTPEEGFSADQYYVPFRIVNKHTKRKPNGAFMALFGVYSEQSSQQNTQTMSNDMMDNNDNNINYDDEKNEIVDNNDIDLIDNDDDNTKHADDGSSPPLNPTIPTYAPPQKTLNPLDQLRERYYKQQLPPSLQPDSLSKHFASDSQKAIQNDLNSDDSILGGIQQMKKMLSKNNE